MLLCMAYLCGFWRPNVDSCASRTSTSQTEPSPFPQINSEENLPLSIWPALLPSFLSLEILFGNECTPCDPSGTDVITLPPSQGRAKNRGLTRLFYIPEYCNWFREVHPPQADRWLSSGQELSLQSCRISLQLFSYGFILLVDFLTEWILGFVHSLPHSLFLPG